VIEFRGVWKSFDRPVLAGIDLTVATGEALAVVGSSGSGKSVLLKATIGIVPIDRGDILIDGRSVVHSPPDVVRAIRRRVGFVFQSGALFDSMGVYDNVSLGLPDEVLRSLPARERMRRVCRALDDVGLEPAALLAKLPADLSGGMRKRVALARALVGEPEILIYDDPFSGLDPVNVARVTQLITSINRRPGATSILVTHDVKGALSMSGRVAVLSEGRMRFVGTPDEFGRSTDPVVAAFRDRAAAAEAARRAVAAYL
jgi:phospholipid/cholesterol/gamma-HCH transport system ATP-binding protein